MRHLNGQRTVLERDTTERKFDANPAPSVAQQIAKAAADSGVSLTLLCAGLIRMMDYGEVRDIGANMYEKLSRPEIPLPIDSPEKLSDLMWIWASETIPASRVNMGDLERELGMAGRTHGVGPSGDASGHVP